MTLKTLSAAGVLMLALACVERTPTPAADSAAVSRSDTLGPAILGGTGWSVAKLGNAPDRFRPGGWSSEDVLWGLVRGRLTRLDIRTGAATTVPHDAWSIHAGPGVVGWRNARGAWMLRDGGDPILVGSAAGSDGPGTMLWSPDGTRLMLSWPGEWDAAYDVIEGDGTKRRLDVSLPGYFGNDAALWLDSTRVLFHTVAKGPGSGAAEYRESGWRGDLAVLDVRTGDYRRVTSVPDTITLRVAGRHPAGVLVAERGPEGPRRFWVYDTRNWHPRAAPVPRGLAFSSAGGAVVVLVDAARDSARVVLVSGGPNKELGRAPLDGEPAFTPSGRRGVMRTARGVIFFESP